MARYDGEMKAAHEVELAEALPDVSAATFEAGNWQEAIACFLSAGEGWREARLLLDGAFAPEEGASSELTRRKGD
ncbi:MAG: hypothetical protein ACJ8EY_02785 [Sphingomicrobium sp.]